MHTVSIEMPDSVAVTLRGFARSLDTKTLPANVVVALFEKGVRRGSNDPLGALFDKGAEVDEKKIDEYWSDLVARWNKGEVQKTRSGGLGRTTDPVQREIKRLANAEVDQNLTQLQAFHGNISRKEFDEQFRSKYVAGRVDKTGKHYERLEKEAKANLAKLAKTAANISGEATDGALADF